MDDPEVGILFGIMVVLALFVVALMKVILHQSIMIKSLREKIDALTKENNKEIPKYDEEVVINAEGGFTIVKRGEDVQA